MSQINKEVFSPSQSASVISVTSLFTLVWAGEHSPKPSPKPAGGTSPLQLTRCNGLMLCECVCICAYVHFIFRKHRSAACLMKEVCSSNNKESNNGKCIFFHFFFF